MTLKELQSLMMRREGEHLEFKEAARAFGIDTLLRYSVALANEGGGKLILGVTDKHPRRIVGTPAFQDTGGMKYKLYETLHIRVSIEELCTPHGRVLVFDVPSRPPATPIPYKGTYLMRVGESVVSMTPDALRHIFAEVEPDFSALPCSEASLSDLDPSAIEAFRARWRRKSDNPALDHFGHEHLLTDADLLIARKPTYAALILLGTPGALGKHLAQAELIFEYRSSESEVRNAQRQNYRRGFFLFHDDLWRNINARNDTQHYQDGLFVWDIPTFNEQVIREAILNAVSHRDYHLPGSVLIRQYPRKIEIVSPGTFPPGVTVENILAKHVPRNRRIAEALEKCGLVERAGQGADLMYRACITESKAKPDYSRTDEYQVWLTLDGNIRDARFLQFLEQVGQERLVSFTVEDFLVLDAIKEEEDIPVALKPRIAHLLKYGTIERVGRGRGTAYILSRTLYGFIGERGVYTRRRGLDRTTNKELLFRHIHDNRPEGTRMRELLQVLPSLSRQQVKALLKELRNEARIRCVGTTKAARWYPAQRG